MKELNNICKNVINNIKKLKDYQEYNRNLLINKKENEINKDIKNDKDRKV